MSNSDKKTTPPAGDEPVATNPAADQSAVAQSAVDVQARETRSDRRRWWIKLVLAPALLLAVGATLIVGLGLAQRWGFISAGADRGPSHAATATDNTRYICPMMCTPPREEPGRCPVCGMELVPLTSGISTGDARSIQIDPVARRIANIETVVVRSMPMTHTVRAIGQLGYDEGNLKMISAYVNGRLERLYADYTGVVVNKGDQLALLYSPQLYASQVELLLAKRAHDGSRSATLERVAQSSRDLYASAKQRLTELGVTDSQIAELEAAGEANSRLYLSAPISGTVIEKLAVEGQYVKEGDAIYKLADLTTVWLMLQLFPEDAAAIRYGQKVEAEVQSLPGRTFSGRVAFIDPNVDPKTRTVGIRVVVPNEDGVLRVGDYAKATIDVPLADSQQTLAYDPELANKWISPRHPHIIEDAPGTCPVCDMDLVPASQFGFTDNPTAENEVLVLPRDAVLMAGDHSVVYVESEPGRFELRRVVLGPISGDQIVIRSGVKRGEQVATRGNFLIDSQMQLAGNPSLIDPTRLEPAAGESSAELPAALAELSPEDRALIAVQELCPVTELQLGAMGTPIKVNVDGSPVFICCENCRKALLSEPGGYLAKLAKIIADSKPKKTLPRAVQAAPAEQGEEISR